jgi:hypothetical protein
LQPRKGGRLVRLRRLLFREWEVSGDAFLIFREPLAEL